MKQFGFAAQPEGSGAYKVKRNEIGAIVTDVTGDRPRVTAVGLLIGEEIASLVNGGYQQFWLTPNNRRMPALASHLKALHAFQEDLKDALGLISLYNTSLGTTSALHLYDRVEDRDDPAEHKPWEITTPSSVQS